MSWNRDFVLIPSVMLLLALAPLPYGYYTLLRLVVTAVAVFAAAIEFKGRQQFTTWSVLLGLIALLFNPIIPVHLTRGMWAVIDTVVALIFVAYWWNSRTRKA